jgi:hypothetical protein
MITVTDITWDQATQNWDTFYADQLYADYILETYGITVPPPYGVLWDHAVLVQGEFVVVEEGAAAEPQNFYDPVQEIYDDINQDNYNKEIKGKRIKLIFIMDDKEQIFEGSQNKKIKVEFKEKLETLVGQKLNRKIELKDVQIIQR